MSAKKQCEIKDDTDSNVKVKYRGDVNLRTVLLSDKCLRKTAVNECLGYGYEYRHHPHQAIVCRRKDPRHKDRDDKLYCLHGESFDGAPDGALDSFFL